MRSPSAEFAHDAIFTVEYDDERTASIVAESLGPTVGELDDVRSQTWVTCEDRTVAVHAGATDPVALRAASNTWLTFVDVAERTRFVGQHAAPDP